MPLVICFNILLTLKRSGSKTWWSYTSSPTNLLSLNSCHLLFHHIFQTLLHPTFPPLSPFPTPPPSASLHQHAERVGSEWVLTRPMAITGRTWNSGLVMKLLKEWQPCGQEGYYLIMRLRKLYRAYMRFREIWGFSKNIYNFALGLHSDLNFS